MDLVNSKFQPGLRWSTMPGSCFSHIPRTPLFASAVRDPVGPIHWAGTETSTHWPSFIDGAIKSGEREAGLIRRRA